MFWFSFFIMMSLVIAVPNFDLRIYSPLKEANIVNYQKEILHIFIQKEEFLRICINDNGSGVNPNEFEKIFTPFYRVDEARTRATGGTGLGLAIVSNVIKEHQGSVWAEKSPLGGLSMNIKLPLWISK
nr:ATP-binding protein [Haemophilus influenzae]